MNLNHMQKNLPWTVPYSWEFKHSNIDNPVRQTSHDMLHIMKSAGRIAEVCEAADHQGATYALVSPALKLIGKELASITMSTMHIAQTHGIDLQAEIEALVFSKNGVSIPQEN